MSHQVIRNEDFISSSIPTNVQNLLYTGAGYPWSLATSTVSQTGALYLDNLTGQLWICVTPNSTATNSWKPFNGQITNNIRISEEVQDGDIIGIFGPGAWSASANNNFIVTNAGAAGSQNATVHAGGVSATVYSITELFNGSAWTTSGNLAQSRTNVNTMAGAQTAGIITGGLVNGATTSLTELFNGTAWSSSANLVSAQRDVLTVGTSNAGLLAGGFIAAATNQSEYFNGAAWTNGATLNIARFADAGFGAQNAALAAGGTTGGGSVITVELFNGSSWAFTANMNVSKQQFTGSGTLNSGFLAGGVITPSVSYRKETEIFNGSTWLLSANLTVSVQASNCSGNPGAGLINGGVTSSGGTTNQTYLHNQSVYRKLNYTNAPGAANIGMAYNVSNTSLTASIITGDVPSVPVPNRTWFGISRFNNEQLASLYSSTTGTISSITASNGSATLNLSATPWDGVAPGNLILINPSLTFNTGSLFPITGGTNARPVVRWENASSSASTSLTFAVCWGQRLTNLTAQSITINGTTMNVNLTFVGGVNVNNTNYGNISYTSFARWVRVNDVLYIPYSTVSGTTGSPLNYGTYLITSIATTSQTAVYTVSVTVQQPSLAATENPSVGIGGLTIYQNSVVNATCLSPGDVVLGFANKMHSPYQAFFDDLDNGLI